ncbi:MAG TPA: hypothetical protein VNN08_14960 [Thermoanaerobaculia bacterium]|nr:hypothetical protein [Thermoanaerobaculia bacterium]
MTSAAASSEPSEAAPAPVAEERPGGLTLFALFLAVGLIAFAYVWMTVHQRSVETLSRTDLPMRAHTILSRWLDHGYFASYGLIWPTPDQKIIYRSFSGGFMISSFLAEKVWMAMTGKYSWRLVALHNEIVALLIAALLGLLAYRLARRLGAEPLHAFVLGVAVEMVWFTFPDNLAGFWRMSEHEYSGFASIGFLLLEERALDGRRTRLLTALQALAIFALTYIECIIGTMFIAAYVAAVLLLREERPPLKRLFVMLLLPWMCAMAVFGIELIGARNESRRTGVQLVGSRFLYRSGLDGDAMFYGDHLDIAYGRDIVRTGRPGNPQYLFRWEWLFIGGVVSVLATLAAYVRRRAPRIMVVALAALVGTYLLYAAVFSQAVVLHPYLFDVLLATPLILALFAIVPALVESLTRRTGVVVLLALFGATWFSLFQLRLYALSYPAPQPAGVLAAPAQPRQQ